MNSQANEEINLLINRHCTRSGVIVYPRSYLREERLLLEPYVFAPPQLPVQALSFRREDHQDKFASGRRHTEEKLARQLQHEDQS